MSGNPGRLSEEEAIEVNYAAFLWQCWEKQNMDARLLTQYEFDLIMAFDKGVRLARESKSPMSNIPAGAEGTIARTRVEDFLPPAGMKTLG